MIKDKKLKIGFIGQGIVGKAVADDFEERGFDIVRYSLDKEYSANKKKINTCDIVFIAVPTPTNNGNQDISAVIESLLLVHKGKTAVIKSTVLPGTTDTLQKKFKDIVIIHSPEFLIAVSAKEDAKKPFVNIIGIPHGKLNDAKYKKVTKDLIAILPKSANEIMCHAVEAELKKFFHNVHGYFQIVFWNMMHDYATDLEADWGTMKKLLDSNMMISKYYTSPLHKTGRGAGGHCFIKDYSAFLKHFSNIRKNDSTALKIFELVEEKNLELLVKTGKDLDLIEKIYSSGKKKK